MIFRAFAGVNLHIVLNVRPVSQLQSQLAHKGLLLVVLSKTRSDQLWTDAETLDESFDFLSKVTTKVSSPLQG